MMYHQYQPDSSNSDIIAPSGEGGISTRFMHCLL